MNDSVVVPSKGSEKSQRFYGYIVVIAAFCVMAVLCATLYSFGVFLKPVAEEFGWSRALTSGAQSLTTFISGLLCMVTGRLTDRFGPRLVTTFCGLVLGLGCLLMAQANAVWQLYLFWGLMVGAGMSGGFVPLTSTIARWFVKRRGLMTGLVIAGVGVGVMFGPLITSQFILWYGWRTSYLLTGSIALVSIILAAQFISRDPEKKGQLPYGSEMGWQGSAPEAHGFSLREAVYTRQFWMLCAMYVLFGLNQMVIMTHIVAYATDQGISTLVAANVMTIIGGVSVAGRVLLGSLADRIGNKRALIVGLVLMTLSLFWLNMASEMWMLYLFAAVFGFGYGGDVALISPVVAEMFGMKKLGSILGVVNFSYHLGCTIGPFLAGRMFDVSGSYYLAFLVCAVLSVISLLLVLPLRPTGRGAQVA